MHKYRIFYVASVSVLALTACVPSLNDPYVICNETGCGDDVEIRVVNEAE